MVIPLKRRDPNLLLQANLSENIVKVSKNSAQLIRVMTLNKEIPVYTLTLPIESRF